MEAVFPLPSVPALLTGVVRLLKASPAASRRERAAVGLAQEGMKLAGKRLFQAESRDDLERLAYELIESPEYVEWRAGLTASLRVLADLNARRPDDDPLVWDESALAVYGLGSKRALQEALTAVDWTLRAVSSALGESAHVPDFAEADLAPFKEPLWFIGHRELHSVVQQSLLSGVLAEVHQLAVLDALTRGESPAPWLALAVAEGWRDNQTQLLRLVASMPGVSIPFEVVSAADRYDIAALDREQEEKASALAKALEAADERMKTTGEPLVPLFPNAPGPSYDD